ncbi:MAG: GNAT family N-acetyltransferase [Bacteroidia bacterium]|nr:GNAT family N-acetyltransferase [Bacteroidia bacterium]
MIRQAGIQDIPAIRVMADVVFRRTYKEILSPEQMEYMMDMMYSEESLQRQLEEGVFFIDEGRGYASARPDGAADDGTPRYHLEKLYVMPEAQKTGLGKQLFETVCDWVKSHEATALLELNVNRYNPSLGFYEHLGMTRARSGDFPIGNGYYMNDYIMAIELSRQ